jgi:archaellum component FlaC
MPLVIILAAIAIIYWLSKRLAEELMLSKIVALKQKLGQIIENKEVFASTSFIAGLQIAITNANLLADDLLSFYRQEHTAKYFPQSITEQIEQYLNNADVQLGALLANDATQNKQLQVNLDQLYALCLQCGLTTFGFNTKDLTKMLDDAKRNVQSIRHKIAEIENHFQRRIKDVEAVAETAKNELTQLAKSQGDGLIAKANNTIKDVETELANFKAAIEGHGKTITSNVQEIDKLKEEVTKAETVAKNSSKSTEEILAIAQTVLGQIKKNQTDSESIKTAIDGTNTNVLAIRHVNSINMFRTTGKVYRWRCMHRCMWWN